MKEIELLTSRRFFPLFFSQLIALLNDNIFKYTLIMLVTFSVVHNTEKAQLLVNLIGGVYGSAFLLFSITIGQLADKFNRVFIIQLNKGFEIILIAIGIVSIYFNTINLSLAIIFLLGLRTAFLSPIKFSLLPDLLPVNELLIGNALLIASAIIAILVGGILGLLMGGQIATAILLCSFSLFLAIFSFVTSLYIPKAPRLDPALQINIKDIFHSFNYAFNDKKIFFPMLALAWSVLVAVVFVRQLPVYTKMYISDNQAYVLTLFLPFMMGIVVGALLCKRIFKALITPRHTALSLFLLSLFLFDFSWATSHLSDVQFQLASFESIRIICDTFLFGLVGGIFIVPLYSNLQLNSHADHRARVLALTNFLMSLFAVLAAVFAIVLIRRHFSIGGIYITIGVLNVFMAFYFIQLSRR